LLFLSFAVDENRLYDHENARPWGMTNNKLIVIIASAYWRVLAYLVADVPLRRISTTSPDINPNPKP